MVVSSPEQTHGSVTAHSQPAPDRGAGCPLEHAVIEGLRLCVGRYAEEARQQLAAAPIGVQRLAVISELLVAEHQAPIQTLVERVELDPGSIQVRSILPTARAFALTRRIADGAQQTITQLLARLQDPELFGLVLKKMPLIEEPETADPFDAIRLRAMRTPQLLLELPHVDPPLIPAQADLAALHAYRVACTEQLAQPIECAFECVVRGIALRIRPQRIDQHARAHFGSAKRDQGLQQLLRFAQAWRDGDRGIPLRQAKAPQ